MTAEVPVGATETIVVPFAMPGALPNIRPTSALVNEPTVRPTVVLPAVVVRWLPTALTRRLSGSVQMSSGRRADHQRHVALHRMRRRDRREALSLTGWILVTGGRRAWR